MDDPLQTVDGPERQPTLPPCAESMPQHIDRYRVERVLGKGGFGLVYLAYDDQLQRLVAIKVPHRNLISRPEDAQAYLGEARTVAHLDHPNIVPVYDAGSDEAHPVFIVSKYIEGITLAERIRNNRPSLLETVELTATVAETLHYAHRKGLVHRDIKPGNILLDSGGKPFVADFGLALREQDVGRGPRSAGTPAYMSPEQANGEGHRVDGRSDIFSLGVVFYELLTGRKPFKGDSRAELLEQIASMEVRPPRQWDDAIPKELERICLKALSKRASDRYTTAKDMADDLRHFVEQATQEDKQSLRSCVAAAAVRSATPTATPVPSPMPTPISDSSPLKIVPKGLRSFDAHDADFFLELLPGPRDRDGLPDSIRFWKTRIEEMDADNTFAVGLIYGPSGCGKSSLVKAGLLPRLSENAIAVYVEAAAAETETRLRNGLRKKCPALPATLGLKETLAALRRGQGIPAGQKVLIVLDQFEQWLHANSLTPTLSPRERAKGEGDLVQALRQCDGGRVQCIVLVRDDFWLAVSRFLRELEIRLVEGQNSALADLFDLSHAQRVLAAFGRAFGKLPDKSGETTKEQKDFLNQATIGLSQEGKVVSVRLALFAEMMKGKPWTPAALKEVGGAQGVGAAFLEETFSAATAPPEHRYHQRAARAVSKALLPESGTDIKGHMRSHAELLAASGYDRQPKEFEELLRILDSEVRLLTPTDPEGKEEQDESGSVGPRRSGAKYYQLTHDYLVPSLCDWLTRKQKETYRGRAELLLADRAVVWNARPENRQLPSLSQWLRIRCLTQKKNWTLPQRKMMRKAARYHSMRGAVVAVLLTVATVIGLVVRDQVEERRQATHAAGLVQALVNADTSQVPAIIAQMTDHRKWADPLLREELDQAAAKSSRKLHASLALLPVDAAQVEYLYGRLLDAEAGQVPVIRDALDPHKDGLLDKLWAVVEAPEEGKVSQRLRAAAALAKFDPESAKWAKAQESVSNDLVAVPAVHLAMWMNALHPVRDKLLPQLSAVYRDPARRDVERSLATDILADYAADNPQTLADLLMDADDKQFAVLYPRLKEQGERSSPVLVGEIDKKLPSDLPSSDEKREKLAKRQANAAVALLRMNQPDKVWPLLNHSPDPRVRSYLIHRLGPMGADAGAIVKRLDDDPDITRRRALILSLGEYSAKELSAEARKAFVPKLKEIYRTESDPGLHAAAEWLLRRWKETTWLQQVTDELARDKETQSKRLESIRQLLNKDKEKTPSQWYVNSQGQTMVVIPGPVEFRMGSPAKEAGRSPDESQHERRIGRTFAVAAKSVTVREFRRFLRANKLEPWFEAHGEAEPVMKKYSPEENCPIILVDWFHAAAYCNWLSEQDGIPPEQWCYETDAQRLSQESLSAGLMLLLQRHPLAAAGTSGYFLLDRQPQVTGLPKNYLSRTGYRLPTEAEMEYATRAGALTSRYYGETEELLPKYAWYLRNSKERSWPVGSLKPNDFGLFDAQGNVYTWGQERHLAYPLKQGEDKEDINSINMQQSRVLRGGSFNYQPSNVRSAYRYEDVPTTRFFDVGLRPARTYR
jgi:serine/threonine protein kinase/formylglycine-generating enzyme required for sulfatase activity